MDRSSLRLRESRGVSSSRLAEKIGISRGYLSRVENGRQVPSIVILDAIGQYFDVGLDYFFAVNSNGHVAVQHAIGDIPNTIPDGATFIYEALCQERGHKLARPFVAIFKPHSRTQVAVHEAEYFRFIMEGRLSLHYEGQVYPLGTGDAIYYDASVPHELQCTSGVQCKVLTIFAKPATFGAPTLKPAMLEGHL